MFYNSPFDEFITRTEGCGGQWNGAGGAALVLGASVSIIASGSGVPLLAYDELNDRVTVVGEV